MIIVGLGNPGKKYAHNRHTVGHMFVDWVAAQQSHSAWHTDPHKLFDYQKLTQSDAKEIIIAKTRTYMNESGKSVLSILRYYKKESAQSLVVAHDDLDLNVGDGKLDFAKGPKLHNGINSIESSNRTNEFWRLRIGVDNRPPENRMAGDVYVLQDFTSEEFVRISALFPALWERLMQMMAADNLRGK